MQGGNKRGKWEEVDGQLNRERLGFYGLAETHLRDLEELPIMEGCSSWAGCNRTGGECRGG